MKKNQSHKTKKQSLKEDKQKADNFYNSGFEHITQKHICLKCNTTSGASECCGVPRYTLGKIARPPKKNASRSKWKAFYKYIVWKHKNFSKESEYKNILKKYNIKDIKNNG